MSAFTMELTPGLRRLRRIAVIAFGLQLTFFITWSAILWAHFSLTGDYAIYWQGWAKITQGHLNPWNSSVGAPFFQDHGFVLLWPIAYVTHFGLGGLAPLFLQDLAVVAAEIIAFAWLLRLLNERELGLPLRNWMIGASSLVFLIANPWTYWAISWDVHLDVTLAAPFVVLALRALYYRQYRSLAVWAVLCLLCGDVAASYVAAIGLTGLLASVRPGHRRLVSSATLLIAGALSFSLISHLQGNTGAAFVASNGLTGSSSGGTIHQISAILLHPSHIIGRVAGQRTNLWALISPAGPLGLLSLWGLPLAVVVAVANSAGGQLFTFAGFQYAALWSPLVVAGVLAARAASGRRWTGRAVSAIVALSVLNTLGWAIVWLPRIDGEWLRVDGNTAQMLDRAEQLIPQSAEVIASQGIVGRFADRSWVYPLGDYSDTKPVKTQDVYFVMVPYQGVEDIQVDDTLKLLAALAGPMHATLVLHGDGVWVFRWTPPSSTTQINTSVPYDRGVVPVWAANSEVGGPVLTGPSQDWLMTTRSRSGGYLVDGAYFLRPLGQYVLRVRLTTTGTTNVEAWNDNGNVLLGRRIVPETNQTTTVDVPVPNVTAYPASFFKGAFGFDTDPIPPLAGQVIEARVYVPPSTVATVYSVRLIRVGN